MNWLRQMWQRFILLFVAAKPIRIADRPAPSRSSDVEEAGRWFFRRDILDRLDEHFQLACRLRRLDPDGYALCARYGATIVQTNAKYRSGMIEHRTIPSFGAIAVLHEANNDDTIPIKYGYFQRLAHQPFDVEQFNGIICRAGMFHLDKKFHGDRVFSEFHFGVLDDGTIKPLRQLHQYFQQLPLRFRRDSNGRMLPIREILVRRGWQYSRDLDTLKTVMTKKRTKAEEIQFIAAFIVNAYHDAISDVRIRCARGGLVATFSVDLLRIPYFFRDRDIEITVGGRRKKIFHIVRTHERIYAGKSGFVRTHFRGARKFDWHGYNITISMPGLHHADPLEADFEGQVFKRGECVPPGMDTMLETVKKIDERFEGAA